jgi:NDP-sugar pyrophosphorylase family protein
VKGVVLAAGEGRRLAPLDLGVPKPMAPLGGRPLLDYTLALLRHYGICDVAINLHHLPEAIPAYFGDGSSMGMRLHYLRETWLSGSAGAVRRFLPFLGQEPFLVLYGDVLTDMNLSDFIAVHRRRQPIATIAVARLDDPSNRGIVQITQDGSVCGFMEKPGYAASAWANGGVYVLDPLVLDYVPPGRAYDFGHDLFPRLLKEGLPVVAYHVPGYLRDIGEPEQYLQAERDLQRGECMTYVDR